MNVEIPNSRRTDLRFFLGKGISMVGFFFIARVGALVNVTYDSEEQARKYVAMAFQVPVSWVKPVPVR